MTYEDYKNLFKKPEYAPTKFTCRACDKVVDYDLHLVCPSCDRLLEWCAISKRNDSFKVRI